MTERTTTMMHRCTTSLLPLLLALAGCAALEPGVYDPALDDQKLSIHVLRSQSREAQRMVANLRTEMEASRQTLAASEVARAQLQGQLREVERRYEEARQIIDLQREELARLRDEREEVLRASRGLQNQMARLQRQVGALTKSYRTHARGGAPAQVQQAAGAFATHAGGENSAEGPTADPLLDGGGFQGAMEANGDGPGVVIVRWGDTLREIARRYKVNYPALRSLNGLDENPDLIFVGQELLLPE